MIIDCHGHYTTSPPQLQAYRDGQIAGARDPAYVPARGNLGITDDQIRQSLEGAQLKIQRERGTNLTIFSPRAMGMGHHIGTEAISKIWSEQCNELIHRVCTLYPNNFVGVCQLPQTPGRAAGELHPRAGTLREGVRLHRLQPEPRSVGGLLDRSAADRQVVVSAVREDGRTRCARR